MVILELIVASVHVDDVVRIVYAESVCSRGRERAREWREMKLAGKQAGGRSSNSKKRASVRARL